MDNSCIKRWFSNYRYNIYRSTTSGTEGSTPVTTVGPATTTYDDIGLTNGQQYFYTVSAVNSVGPSSASTEANGTPAAAATVPGAPTGLIPTVGDSHISLSWTAPASNGGSPITGYNIYRSTTSGTEGSTPVATVGPATTTYDDIGLTNGQQYFYTVSAVNSVGPSSASTEANGTPAATATVPGAPTGLIPTVGDSHISLSWTTPASNGGSPITGYNIYRSTTSGTEGSTPVATVGPATTTYDDIGLTNGQQYFYTVSAVNSVGPSSASTEANGTPAAAATVPGAPTGLIPTVGDSHISLSWTTPASNGGSPITGYNIYRSTTSGTEGSTPVATVGPATTTYDDIGLTNGQQYFYTVSAVNSVGPSSASTEANGTPAAAATVPGAPTGLIPTVGDSHISLSWTAPASNGGSPITGYNIYRSTTSGTEGSTPVTTVGPATTTYDDIGLTNGQQYFYTVSAVNSVGPSSASTEANGTPAAAATVPGAPTGLTPTVGDSHISLSWTLLHPTVVLQLQDTISIVAQHLVQKDQHQ